MVSNAALKQYIVVQQGLGKSEAEIKTVLLSQGWSIATIEEEFALLKGEAVPVPPAGATQAVVSGETTSTGTTVLTVLLLIFLTPIGLAIMWIGTKWSNKTKWVITILFGILPILAIIAIMAAAVLVAVNPAAQIERAKMVATKSTAESILNAAEQYHAMNDVYPTDIPELIAADVMTSKLIDQNQDYAVYSLKSMNNGNDCELTVTITEKDPVVVTCSNPDLTALTMPSAE